MLQCNKLNHYATLCLNIETFADVLGNIINKILSKMPLSSVEILITSTIHEFRDTDGFGGLSVSSRRWHDATDLNVVKNVPSTCTVNSLVNQYSECCHAIGKLNIDETVKPVAQSHKKIPFFTQES